MEHWQALRADRSKFQDIHCERLAYTDTSAVFSVVGTQGDVYEVEMAEDIDLWPPSCNCEDFVWRGPDVLCKHIMYCLRHMGVEEESLRELCWEPADQEEWLEIFVHAPDAVGATISDTE